MTALPRQLHQVAFVKGAILLGQDKQDFALALLGIAILLGVHILQSNVHLGEVFARQRIGLRWGVYYAALILILFFGAFNQSQQFIYFQF